MEHEYSDCHYCGGEVKEELTELDYRYKQKLYIFENVPAGVCAQCGEKYLVSNVAKNIEKRIQTKNTWERTISVPVEEFEKVILIS